MCAPERPSKPGAYASVVADHESSTSRGLPPPQGEKKSLPPGAGRPQPPQGTSPGRYGLSPLSWIVFFLLMVWNVWSFLPKPTSEVALPYSAFVTQVTAANVTETRIVGDQISGIFVHAIAWREAVKSESTKDTPDKKTGEAPPPPSYPGFRTTFPSVVGDPLLMPLLQAHHVVIDVATPSEPWFTIVLTNGLPVLLLGVSACLDGPAGRP